MASDLPDWLNPLLCSEFFVPCNVHPELSRNEKNRFCMDCKLCLCQHCVNDSSTDQSCAHVHLLKIWVNDFNYQDVVDLDVIQQHFDCSTIQVYKINEKEAVQLTGDENGNIIGNGTYCENCGTKFGKSNDHYGYRFCSIGCKVAVLYSHIERNQSQDSEVPNLEDAEEVSSGNAQVNEPPDSSPDLNQDMNEPDMNQDINEPDIDQDINEPDIDQDINEPDINQDMNEPDIDQDVNEPDIDQDVNEPDIDQDVNEPDIDQDVNEPDTDQDINEPDIDQNVNEPDIDQDINEPDIDQDVNEPDIDQDINEPDIDQDMNEPDIDQDMNEPDLNPNKRLRPRKSSNPKRAPMF